MRSLRTLANHNGNTLLTPTLSTSEPESFSTGTDFAHLEEMASAVAEQCAQHPTLIVLDDLHRAERSTREVLELLSSFVNRMPLLVLATWQDAGMNRPMHEREFDQLLSRCEVTLMRLRGLGRDATAQLIEKVFGSDAHTGVRRLRRHPHRRESVPHQGIDPVAL